MHGDGSTTDRAGAAALLDASPEVILLLDPGGKILEANAAYLARHGRTREQALGSNVFDEFPPEVAARRRAKLQRSADTGEGSHFEDERDGRVYETHMHPLRNAAGQVDRVAVYTRDITEVRAAQRALGASEARLRVITETLPVPLFVSRLSDGRILFANEGLHVLLGQSPGSLVGQLTPSLYERPQDRADFLTQLQADGRVRNREVPIVLPDGRRRIIWASADLIELDSEPVMMGSFIDVTERREAEARLVQLQRMDAVGQLAGGIAHDFNNLLTVIDGRTCMAVSTLPADHAAIGELEQVAEASRRAADLTAQLLAYGRRQILQPRAVDLNAVVRGLGKMLKRLIAENIKLVSELGESLDEVWVDPSQLQQVVMNLMLNARDAMPDGGTLTVQTVAEHGDPKAPRPRVRLSVHDTGVGMDAATAARAFEPFFTTKPVDRGTGLGLATVHGIVEQSGGEIRLESTPGAGSSFHVWFNCSEGSDGSQQVVSAARVPAPPAQSPARVTTVLLVEDEAMVRSLAERMLRALGHEVLSAEDGEAATVLCSAHAGVIDVLLTDVIMPGVGGDQLAAQLCEQRPDMGVIFMSGYPNAAGAPHPGGAPWLRKPFDLSALSAAVQQALETRR